jgi:hypothetical protein
MDIYHLQRNKNMITKEEKESIDDMALRFKELINDYQNLTETMLELLLFMKSICAELAPSNPVIANRIVNKVTDILDRQTKGINKSSL